MARKSKQRLELAPGVCVGLLGTDRQTDRQTEERDDDGADRRELDTSAIGDFAPVAAIPEPIALAGAREDGWA